MESTKREIEIIQKIDHENVVKVFEVFETITSYCIVQEFVPGELLDSAFNRKLLEEDTRFIFVQILKGVKYLHNAGIVHRDLKLDNILVDKNPLGWKIKIIDFGLAIIQHSNKLKSLCGTMQYIAPEVLQKIGYDNKVDMWSCGIILFILLTGEFPFEDDKIQIDDLFGGERWKKIPGEAKDLLNKLLVSNPEQRLSAADALKHPWITGVKIQDTLQNEILPVNGIKIFKPIAVYPKKY